jgi:hypothetical protein
MRGKITARGVDVVDGDVPPPIRVTLHDHSISITGSTGVIVGSGNKQNIVGDIGKIHAAIDHSHASDGEKQEAKSLLQKLVGNATLWSILGTFFSGGSAQ